MAKVLDGEEVASVIKSEIKSEIKKHKLQPALDVILVGKNEASKIYVKKKCQACDEVGINSGVHIFTENDFNQVKYLIEDLNCDDEVNGILVQLPLPQGWDTSFFFDLLNPIKDVDVFSPVNVGLLVQNRPRFLPPTPHAVQKILSHYGLTLNGKHVVVINRSNIVGKPLSSMLIQDNGTYANATVTVCHDQTPPVQLKTLCLNADVIVVAVGIPNFLMPDMVRHGQIVIDVGINRIGKKIVGDVHPLVAEKVDWISPVPGGIGPVTVSMLLYNTLEASKLYE